MQHAIVGLDRSTLHTAEDLRRLGNELIEMANSLSSEPRQRRTLNGREADEIDWRALIPVAKMLYKLRGQRNTIFGEELFGEPAWDMLLDLFVMYADAKHVRVTSACIASRVPPTTALRWLGVLEAEGLIERAPSLQDSRVTYVQLTSIGFMKIVESLSTFAKSLHLASPPRFIEANSKTDSRDTNRHPRAIAAV